MKEEKIHSPVFPSQGFVPAIFDKSLSMRARFKKSYPKEWRFEGALPFLNSMEIEGKKKPKEVAMKERRIWLTALVLVLFVLAGTKGWTAEPSIQEKVKMAEDWIAGKIPYTGPPVKYTGPPITIRYSTFMSQGSKQFYDMYSAAAKQLEKESNGKLVLKGYFSNVLHGPRDGFKACVDNITDYTHGYSLWQPKSFNMLPGLALPFAFPDSVVSQIVAEKLAPKYFKKEYEQLGVDLAGIQVTRPYHLLSKKPIRKLEDVKGLKIRSGGGIMADIVKALGAIPVMLPASEFYTGFQRGVFDAILSHDTGFVVFRVNEIGKYVTELFITQGNTEFALNKKFFDGLPRDLKVIFYNWLRKYNAIYEQIYYEKEGVFARQKMEKDGIKTIILPPEEKKRWEAAVDPVWDKFVKQNEAKGLPAKAMVRDMRALSKKYSVVPWNEVMKEVISNPVQGLIDF
jgi:TRAP-type C4-dicarboxylate transport system substrate-binding protein